MKHLLPTIVFLSGFLMPARAQSDFSAPVTAPGAVTADVSFEVAGELARPVLRPSLIPGNTSGDLSERNARAMRAWQHSLIPLAASQALDITSSYGMRELNPMLAGPDGRFGSKAATIKLSAAVGVVAIEYGLVRRWPGSARLLSRLNWANALVTGGFAVHNFAIR